MCKTLTTRRLKEPSSYMAKNPVGKLRLRPMLHFCQSIKSVALFRAIARVRSIHHPFRISYIRDPLLVFIANGLWNMGLG